MMKVRNTLGFENTPFTVPKIHLPVIHMYSKQVFKQISMSSNTQLSTKAPHHAIIIQNTFTGEYNLP